MNTPRDAWIGDNKRVKIPSAVKKKTDFRRHKQLYSLLHDCGAPLQQKCADAATLLAKPQ
jgi:hypothetical protein